MYSAVVLLGVLVVVFALVHLVPGDPVRIALGTRYTPEAYTALRSASGLDRPLVEQFFSYIGSAITGDLGVSFRNGDPVTLTCWTGCPPRCRWPSSGSSSRCSSRCPAGIWVGAAGGPAQRRDRARRSQFGVSIPDFWMGILLIGLFAATLGWLPTSGYVPLTTDPARLVAARRPARCDRRRRGGGDHDPLYPFGGAGSRVDGIRAHRQVEGPAPRVVTLRHILRNALVPVLTITGIQLATILGGVIVVEVVFAWPGLGRLVYNAVAARDYPVIQGAVLLIAAMFLLINLIVDVLYAVVDPRIRLS